MPPSFCDRGVIEVYQGNHQPGLKALSTTHQCAMGPTDPCNCLGVGAAPACYSSLPPSIQHSSRVAHSFGMASFRPNGQQPLEVAGNAKYAGCTRTTGNEKCVDVIADEHLGALRAAYESRHLILELGGLQICAVFARSALGHLVVPNAIVKGSHGIYAAGVTSRSAGSDFLEKLRHTSGELKTVVEEYASAMPLLGLPSRSVKDVYIEVRDAMGHEKYMSWEDLHRPGALPAKLLYSRHQAAEGAKKGNYADISGTSQFGVLFTECSQGMMVMGTFSLSMGRSQIVKEQLSIPGHASTDCTDPHCPVRLLRPNQGSLHRALKAPGLSDSLDVTWAGGEPVWIGAGGPRVLITPCQPCSTFM